MTAENLLSPGQHPGIEVSVETGLAQNSVLCSRSEFVLVDEAAEEVESVHAGQWRRRVASSRSDGGRRIGRLEVERAVRPPAVVVEHVDAENVLELAAAENQEPVEALAADTADPALDVRVRVRRPNRELSVEFV
jgi:hypothetical protein